MRILLYIFFACILFNPMYAQQNTELWRLPVRDNKIVYTESRTIETRNHELCEYFIYQLFQDDLKDTMKTICRRLDEGNSMSGCTSCSYEMEFQKGSASQPLKDSYCNPDGNDTIYGRLIYRIDWTSNAIINGSHRTRYSTIDFNVTIICMNTSDIYISLEGKTYKLEEYHPGKDQVKNYEYDLVQAYTDFANSEDKSKKDRLVFIRINELSRAFLSTLYAAFEREVRYDQN